jgi:hypothetical protein
MFSLGERWHFPRAIRSQFSPTPRSYCSKALSAMKMDSLLKSDPAKGPVAQTVESSPVPATQPLSPPTPGSSLARAFRSNSSQSPPFSVPQSRMWAQDICRAAPRSGSSPGSANAAFVRYRSLDWLRCRRLTRISAARAPRHCDQVMIPC